MPVEIPVFESFMDMVISAAVVIVGAVLWYLKNHVKSLEDKVDGVVTKVEKIDVTVNVDGEKTEVKQ